MLIIGGQVPIIGVISVRPCVTAAKLAAAAARGAAQCVKAPTARGAYVMAGVTHGRTADHCTQISPPRHANPPKSANLGTPDNQSSQLGHTSRPKTVSVRGCSLIRGVPVYPSTPVASSA